MNGMLGMTQLLMGTPLDEKQRRFAQTIRSSGQSLLDIINDILDFSKIEAGRLELDKHPFNVNELIEETADLFAAGATEKGLELVCSTPPGPALQVSGDAARLKQVLINLVANAVKFTPEGEVMIRYKIADETSSGVSLCFEVIDTGIGIKADKRCCSLRVVRAGGRFHVEALRRHRPWLGDLSAAHPGDGRRDRGQQQARGGLALLVHVASRDAPSAFPCRPTSFTNSRVCARSLSTTIAGSNVVVSGYLAALGMQVVQAYTGDTALRQLHAASFGQSFDVLILDAESSETRTRNDLVQAIRAQFGPAEHAHTDHGANARHRR